MRTYRLVIAYDGTAYQGWQRQANTEMTIQGILESCISKAAGYAVEVNGSGRTDPDIFCICSLCISLKETIRYNKF